MPTPLTTHLITLFQQDLDAKSDEAIMRMASEWLKVERSLQDEILLLATELASPPGAVKLDPISEMVLTMKQVGYAPDYISQLLATQGIFKIPDVPQPQAKQISDWQLAQLQRYVRLLAQVQQQIEAFTGQTATPVIEQLRNDAALAGIENAIAMIDATISSAGAGVIDLTFDRLNIEATQNIVAISGAGKPLGDLLQAAYPLAANGITNELVYGTAVGRNPRQTAQKIVNGGMAQALNHILLVARDQQNRAAREGTRQQYLKSGIVQQYRRRAAHQARTCLACLALDGKVYDVAELMELHPQDRCSMIPIVPGFESAQGETGEQWFNRQSEAVQREMMGPGRYEAWKRGEFEFSQLATVKDNATWGPSAQVTTLKDLLKGKGGVPPRKLSKDDFTSEYWEAADELSAIEQDGEFYEGELQDARDRLSAEEEVSRVARERGLKPGTMDQRQWKALANQLQSEALEDLRGATKADREAAGNRRVGRRRVSGSDDTQFTQLGGQTVERKWTGGSASAARRATQQINKETERAATEYMGRKLVEFGYSPQTTDTLDYNKMRRLMAEIGHGQPQAANIGGVSKAERERVISGLTPRQRAAALEVAYNPRAGAGMDKWLQYELAMVKAGLEGEIQPPPDVREDYIPDFVRYPGSKRPANDTIPSFSDTNEIDF